MVLYGIAVKNLLSTLIFKEGLGRLLFKSKILLTNKQQNPPCILLLRKHENTCFKTSHSIA